MFFLDPQTGRFPSIAPTLSNPFTGFILPGAGAITSIARDPERRDRLYAATGTGLLFESGNRGVHWQPVNAAPVAPVRSLYVVRI